MAGATLLGLAIAALPQAGIAQSDPATGLWQLNFAKSRYRLLPKSETVYVQAEGQNLKLTSVGISAEGNSYSAVDTWIFDRMPHPVTGYPRFDAVTSTRVNAYTINNSRIKAGKLVETETVVVSPDGKTATSTVTGTNANGQQINIVEVYDKQ
jgi:hypothetical protein